MVKVLIKKLNSAAQIPSYKTEGASGMDLMAFTNKPIKLAAKSSCLVPTGLSVAFSNDYDRFIHEGVVDMVFWHCGFNFAVFNYADIAIDFAVALILVMVYFFPEDEEKE